VEALKMRQVGTIIVITIVLVVGLVLFLVWGPMAEKPGMRTVVSIPETPGSKAAPAKTEPSHQRSHTTGKHGEQAAQEVAGSAPSGGTPATAGGPAEAAGTPRSVRPFPTVADIPPGTARSKLQAAYGKPNIVTTVLDGGRLVETFVYLRPDPNAATIVLLRNGRVVGANTTDY
jgi:hypothetical protein